MIKNLNDDDCPARIKSVIEVNLNEYKDMIDDHFNFEEDDGEPVSELKQMVLDFVKQIDEISDDEM